MKLSLGKCWGLLIFDIIGLAISGYAYLLGYQIITTLSNANAFIILMGFFVGIKVVVLSLYDLNRNMLHKNIPFLGALISIVGNGIIFALCWFLIPEVPVIFFIGLSIVDFLMVTLCHLLWWVLIGKDDEGTRITDAIDAKDDLVKIDKKSGKKKDEVSKKKRGAKEKKTWLNQDDDEGSEYDSIFTSLLENEKKGQKSYREPEKINVFEEKRYQTSDFLNEIKENLKKDQSMPAQRSETRAIPISQSPEQRQKLGENRTSSEIPGKKKEVINSELSLNKMNKEDEQLKNKSTNRMIDATVPLSKMDGNNLFADLPGIQGEEKTVAVKSGDRSDHDLKTNESGAESEEDFLMIERRLGFLLGEIEKSMKETQYLQNAVGDFQKEVETYTPITSDEKIIAAGNLIREKLKTIIDKQFVVDEVLDDLIRLSKLINNRINDLDIIEAGLNQRKIALDQKDLLFVEERSRSAEDAEIEIMPEELVMEDLDSEFIVAEGDYDTIRKYLTQNK
ncbi:hypothetical protein GH808_14530 [Acetobacterium fimetarium]|uniref:Uncharacterized protein n=1 Tax=Acetobacterium fimetarium TaxID=52691 RepID=A0ABR6WYB5_9FIRM|nr:hypothetical protein [Acetobacterium fimetarium]MBC3805623.1 hypothetical protein [Acetobacterium fimetarium]